MSLLNTYNYLSINVTSAKGNFIFDDSGNNYLDTYSGLGVCILGHSHPEIIEVIKHQLSKYTHLCNYFKTKEAVILADKLIKLSNMNSVFFANSGTEAIECALKIVRKHSPKNKMKIFSLSHSFHGRTCGALSLCSNNDIKKDFDTIEDIEVVDDDELIEKISNNTAAVFIEFIRGEGGIITIKDKTMQKLIALKKKYGFLIVADEIQAGCFRTGRFLASEDYKKYIDIITLGKGLGGGLPLSACIVSKKLKDIFSIGDHGSTFGGNPVACAAGLKVIEIIQRDNICNKITKNSEYVFSKLLDYKKRFPDFILDIRGKGYMIGIELKDENIASELKEFMFNNHILINITSKTVWRLLPSYTFSIELWDKLLNAFSIFLNERS